MNRKHFKTALCHAHNLYRFGLVCIAKPKRANRLRLLITSVKGAQFWQLLCKSPVRHFADRKAPDLQNTCSDINVVVWISGSRRLETDDGTVVEVSKFGDVIRRLAESQCSSRNQQVFTQTFNVCKVLWQILQGRENWDQQTISQSVKEERVRTHFHKGRGGGK